MAMGHVARATQHGEEAVDGRGGRHDRAHRHASCAPGAARDVHVEGAAQECGPIRAASDGSTDGLGDALTTWCGLLGGSMTTAKAGSGGSGGEGQAGQGGGTGGGGVGPGNATNDPSAS